MQRFSSIQIARAFAAVAVVYAHSINVTNDLTANASPGGTFSFGPAGVDLFFVISGFIISLVTVGENRRPADFVLKRTIRIYPFYWAFTVAWITVSVVGHRAAPSPGLTIASMLALPIRGFPVLGVGWSLEHEFIFYALAAVMLAFRRADRLLWLLLVMTGLSFLVNLFDPKLASNNADFHLLSPYHFEFMCGIIVFRYRQKIGRLNWPLCCGIGASLFPAISWVLHTHFGEIPTESVGLFGIVKVVSYGGASSLLLAGLLALEAQRGQLLRSLPARAVEEVGNASYALYLLHPILFAVLGKVLGRYWPHENAIWLAVAFAISLAVGAAVCWYRIVEKPVLQLVSKSRRRSSLSLIDGPA